MKINLNLNSDIKSPLKLIQNDTNLAHEFYNFKTENRLQNLRGQKIRKFPKKLDF